MGMSSRMGSETRPGRSPRTVAVSQLSRYPSRGRRVMVAGTNTRSSKLGIRRLNVL